MKVIFDPDIPEDFKDELSEEIKNLEKELQGKCPECGSDTIYVALIDNVIDIKCYECGYSFMEIELEEE